MDSQSDLKTVGLLVLGALVVLGTLGRLIYNDLFGTSELVVFAPPGGDARVSLDGDAPVTVEAGHSHIFEARRGAHEVVSTVDGEHFPVKVKLGSGGPRYAVPTTSNQCFAVADVTSMYAHSTVLAQARHSQKVLDSLQPRLESRLVDHGAVKLPKFTVVGMRAMPATRKKGEIFVLQAFECDRMKVSDGDLLAMMGLD
jgi:hypothetical protein